MDRSANIGQHLPIVGQKAPPSANALAIVDAAFNPAEWTERLQEAAVEPLAQAMADGAIEELRLNQAALKVRAARQKRTSAEEIADRLDIEVPEGVSLDFPEWLREHLAEELEDLFQQPYWLTINETTRTDIARSVDAGLQEGWSIRRIADAIQDQHAEYSRARATTVARTECLVGETVVDGAYINAAYKREYIGDLVEVIADAGRKITGTANHPMLTTRGWVALGELTEADYLVGYEFDAEQSSSAGNENVKAPPATISEVFDSLAAVSLPSRERTRKPDFHGDGMDGYVDVLRTDRELRHGRFTPIEQSRFDLAFTEADLSAILLAALRNPFPTAASVLVASRLCDTSQLAASPADDAADSRFVDPESLGNLASHDAGGVEAGNLIFREIFGIGRLGAVLKLVARRLCDVSHEASTPNGPSNGIAPNVQVSCNFDGTLSAGVKVADDPLNVFRQSLVIPEFLATVKKFFGFGGGAKLDAGPADRSTNRVRADTELDSDFVGGQAGKVKAYRVRSLRIIKGASCHVYNLTTSVGYFTANGLYTGNTTGAMNSGHVMGIRRLQEETGLEMGKEFLSVLGPTTRDTHADADGQTVGVDDDFNIGGHKAPYPGHPSLPVSERANCQCSVVSTFVGEATREDLELVGE